MSYVAGIDIDRIGDHLAQWDLCFIKMQGCAHASPLRVGELGMSPTGKHSIDSQAAATPEHARDDTTTTLEARQGTSDCTIFTHIAHALARGFTDLYHVNMETDEFKSVNLLMNGGSCNGICNLK